MLPFFFFFSDLKYTLIFFLPLAYVHVSLCLTALKWEQWCAYPKSALIIFTLLSHNSRYVVSKMRHKKQIKIELQ